MAVTKKSEFAGLADSLVKTLNKRFKDTEINIITENNVDSITKITDWIPTGCDVLDMAISNSPVGGYPCGRISVLYGKEQSGKSLLSAHALANTQKKNGLAVYIDTEMAYHEQFFNAVGVQTVDTENWMYVPQNSLEVVLTFIEQLIPAVRAIDKTKLITIVVDSFIASHTDEEIKGDYGLKGYNTSKSIIIANGLARLIKIIAAENVCLIITNQVRQKLAAQPFEDPWRMPGGQALPHYASVMIKLDSSTNKMSEINSLNRVIGRSTKAKITKNRLGPPLMSVNFDIYYDRGIDNYGSWIEYMKIFKIGKHAGAYISYNAGGTEFKGQGKTEFAKLLSDNEVLRDSIWKEICENFIMAYATGDGTMINVDAVKDVDISPEDEI